MPKGKVFTNISRRILKIPKAEIIKFKFEGFISHKEILKKIYKL